jgi:hypothetical protein
MKELRLAFWLKLSSQPCEAQAQYLPFQSLTFFILSSPLYPESGVVTSIWKLLPKL